MNNKKQGEKYMETYGRFLFEFLHQFFSGFGEIFGGLWKGILNIFNIPEYYYIIQNYVPVQVPCNEDDNLF